MINGKRMRPKILPAYLATVAIWQAMIYAGISLGPDSSIYFDPRIGFWLLGEGTSVRGALGMVQWLSVIILLILAGAIAIHDRTIALYLVIEPLLAMPTLVFFFLVLWANISPSHGFSVAELSIPVLVFVVCTVVPWTWAAMLFRSRAHRPAS